MNLEIVFITTDSPFPFPNIVSILEEDNILKIRTVDIIDIEFHGLDDHEKGAHVWTFDPSIFYNRPDAKNHSGIFPLDGHIPSQIVHGVGYPPGILGKNLHEEKMKCGGLMPHFFRFGNSENFEGRIGFLVLRRQNEIENDPSLLFIAIKSTTHVQTTFPYTVVSSLEEAKTHLKTENVMPFDLNCDMIKTCSGPMKCTLTATTRLGYLPDGLDYFYIQPDKGSVDPSEIRLNKGKATFTFDPSDMSVNETATIKIGIDGMGRYKTFRTTKV